MSTSSERDRTATNCRWTKMPSQVISGNVGTGGRSVDRRSQPIELRKSESSPSDGNLAHRSTQILIETVCPKRISRSDRPGGEPWPQGYSGRRYVRPRPRRQQLSSRSIGSEHVNHGCVHRDVPQRPIENGDRVAWQRLRRAFPAGQAGPPAGPATRLLRPARRAAAPALRRGGGRILHLRRLLVAARRGGLPRGSRRPSSRW